MIEKDCPGAALTTLTIVVTISAMITVGVIDLKNQLSQYLQYVEEGEGRIVPAKRGKSRVKLPAIKERLDWKSVYSEIRTDRTL